jgi:hypothetical protein
MSSSVVSPETIGIPERIDEASGIVLERSAIISSASRVGCLASPISTASICTSRVTLLEDWLNPLSPTGGSAYCSLSEILLTANSGTLPIRTETDCLTISDMNSSITSRFARP